MDNVKLNNIKNINYKELYLKECAKNERLEKILEENNIVYIDINDYVK